VSADPATRLVFGDASKFRSFSWSAMLPQYEFLRLVDAIIKYSGVLALLATED
jgi:hypothetical protein